MPQCTDISTVCIMLKYTFMLDDEGYVSLWLHMIYAAICVLRIEQLILSTGAVKPKCIVFILVIKFSFCQVFTHDVIIWRTLFDPLPFYSLKHLSVPPPQSWPYVSVQ